MIDRELHELYGILSFSIAGMTVFMSSIGIELQQVVGYHEKLIACYMYFVYCYF